MSQNTRNQQSDSHGNSGRDTGANGDGRNYEGFEGMNYEQIRQPYNPQHSSNDDRDDINGGGKRRDEM